VIENYMHQVHDNYDYRTN